jgi:hypothetical protein
MFTLRLLLLLGLVTLATGCDRAPDSKRSAATDANGVPVDPGKPVTPSWADQAAKPRIPQEKAQEIVLALVKEKQINLERFQAPKISFSVLRHEWDFEYQMKPPVVPGGHFTVVVEDSGGTRFISGR